MLGGGEMFVPQILFQFKNGERFLGVVEHGSDGCPCSVTGDLPSVVLLRDASLPAQERDEHLIDISIPDALTPIGKEKLYRLARLWVNFSKLLFRSDLLPFGNTFAHQWVDGFGVRSRGFVHWDLKKAGSVLG